jgi:hypothetical protein
MTFDSVPERIRIVAVKPQLVFPAGSAVLHYAYGLPRKPHDLDVMVATEDFSEFELYLENRFGYEPEITKEKMMVANERDIVHCRKLEVYGYHFDCLTTESFDRRREEIVEPMFFNGCSMMGVRLEEILAIKIIWLLWFSQGREIFRGKDIYDLWWFIEREIPSKRRFIEAIEKYCDDFAVPPLKPNDPRIDRKEFLLGFDDQRGSFPESPDYADCIETIYRYLP